MPERPDDLEFAEEDEIHVAQVYPSFLFACSTKVILIMFWACHMPSVSTECYMQLLTNYSLVFLTPPTPQTDAFMYAYKNTTAAVHSMSIE